MTTTAFRPVAVRWVRKNLFSTPLNVFLTIVLGAAIVYLAYLVIRFLATSNFEILRVNLALFMVGSFPRAQLSRVVVAMLLLAIMAGLAGGMLKAAARERSKDAGIRLAEVRGSRAAGSWLRRFWPLSLLVIAALALTRTLAPTLVAIAVVALLIASRWLGAHLRPVLRRVGWIVVVLLPLTAYWILSASGLGWEDWGGFMLNIFLTIAGILFAFPIGVALALGRRSTLPVVRAFSIGYIELIRGVPLITLLLMAVFALGFFLPRDLRPGSVTRVLIVITAFEAAYIAEVVRGGLQSVPRGQSEAAQSLGLPTLKITRLIVLPQALRATIPAMVGQFISLFKDTTLVAIVGLGDILAASSFANAQPAFNAQGLARITLPFVALAFWAGSFAMSREARRLERRLGIGER
ncbi:MAG TPA: amino acid ABC transporter permease [Acidimicrobiia bacterium]|nr:amino acid ABC transporter permease [Acidimicrobiia bacterium]